jgi:hypothetical protein
VQYRLWFFYGGFGICGEDMLAKRKNTRVNQNIFEFTRVFLLIGKSFYLFFRQNSCFA